MSEFVANGLLGFGLVPSAASQDSNDAPQTSTTAIQPNGLLGSTTNTLPEPNGLLRPALLSNSHDSTELRPEATATVALQPNGLLGLSPSKTVQEGDGGLSIQPNGFLGSSFNSTQALQPASQLEPNGLLGLSSDAYENQEMDLQSINETRLDSRDIEADLFAAERNNLLGTEPPSSAQSPDTPVESPDSSQEIPALLGPTRTSTSSFSTQSIRAVTFSGKPLHIKRKVRRSEDINAPSGAYRPNKFKLLDVPMHRMLDMLSLQKAEQLQAEQQQQHQEVKSAPAEDALWVDRYRPRKFTDLLGNERGAREAMSWLKQWDWCVFGRNKNRKTRKTDESTNKEDEYRRPEEKFLLISGPPGLGKTTLAHVISRQAGYEVLEINASDARTGNIVDDRIRPTLEAGSTVGGTKPVLVIIDEIDGATGGDNSNNFVYKLIQLMQAKTRKKQRNGQRDTCAPRPILRPIICICNDINASSIAKLRPHALQIRFNKPSDVHTVKRLREICLVEGLKADARALATLVAVAKGDLRGCLNTLQFIKSKSADVTEPTIRQATVGMKQSEGSIQTVLSSLFTPLSKKRVKELGLTESEEARYISRLYQEIDSCGREAGIATACFGHYATLRNHDANLARHEQAIEWLGTFDTMSNAMYADGDFTLHHYLPYTLIPFFPLFKERSGERIERSQADWEHIQLLHTNEEVYKSLSRSLRSAALRNNGDFRHFSETPVLQTEFAPMFNRIISPPLRPVNSQVIKPDEKALLNRLVNIMASVDLRFVRERNEEGQLSYRLDPPIDVFITYDGKRAPDIPVSRYAVRHLVAAEVDAKLTERDTEYVEKAKRGKHADSFKSGSGSLDFNPKRAREGEGHDGRQLKRTKLGATELDEEKPPVDFFGRRITVPAKGGAKFTSRKVSHDKPYRVSYRFAQGNSAAVRRPVKMGAFL